jgi:hypothetical protein
MTVPKSVPVTSDKEKDICELPRTENCTFSSNLHTRISCAIVSLKLMCAF